MKCVFVGNFNVPYTTEEHRSKSFEEMGVEVIRMQEDKTTANDVLGVMNEVSALFYSHTHSPDWEIAGLKEVFLTYKDAGVPTASIHLDRFAWLSRQEDVGREASWYTEHYFSADGSPESVELFKKTGQKFHWLRPGVYSGGCYMADEDRSRFPHDVIFLGSKGYHSEYPFRPKLIDWLAQTYGERFGTYGNDGLGVMREANLNMLLASSKVVVGDSCFGGRPRYVSDRYYEVPGRGGFLLHPYVDQETMENPWVATFEKENFDDLKEKIDYYLENRNDRERLRKMAHNWVKEHGTYSKRCEEMLGVMGL